MSGARGIFFEESHALAAVGRLRREGYAATLARERLAGEDDDEDRHFVVTTDAPEVTLELLVEEHDGWLDVPDPPAGPVSSYRPVTLPTSPRRHHRHRSG